MSALDAWGTIESSCPSCGGNVEYFYFSSDCRGNPSSQGFECKSCKDKGDTIPPWVREHVRSGKPVVGRQGSL